MGKEYREGRGVTYIFILRIKMCPLLPVGGWDREAGWAKRVKYTNYSVLGAILKHEKLKKKLLAA